MQHRMVKSVCTISALVTGLMFFFCTISENNGNPAAPGSAPVDTPATVIDTTLVPALIAAADSAYVRVGDTMTIRIKLLEDSSAVSVAPLVNGVVTSSANRGWLSAKTLRTDINGRATLLFSDSVEGLVEITVAAYSVSKKIRISITNTPDQIQKRIDAWPENPTIKADGQSFTYVNVKVINEDHNPIVGESVRFIATAGVIAGVQPPAGATNAGLSVTNADGVARAKLTSSNINDTSFVTVFLDSDQSRSDETRVAFQGVTIKTVVDSSNLTIGQGTLVTATLLNGSAAPIANAPIFFSLGGGATSNLTMVSRDSVTGFDGTAHLYIKGTRDGTDSVIVIAAGSRSVLTINVTNLILSINLRSNILQAREDISTYLDVTFTDIKGAALTDKAVRIIRHYPLSNGSTFSDTLTGVTNSSGKSAFQIYGLPYDALMRLEVTAYNRSTDIASAETSLRFITTRDMTIYALPSIIQADGSSTSKITVQIKNQENNNPIVGDTIVFSTTAGLVQARGVTDDNGKAIVTLTSDRRNALATVTSTFIKDPSMVRTVKVEYVGVELSASANPRSINSSGFDTSKIVINLLDAAKNPIVGEAYDCFSQNRDQTFVIKVDSVTNNRGQAVAKVFGTATGNDTITITAAGASATTVINYSPNILRIDTLPGYSHVANGIHTTGFSLSYRAGDGLTPLVNVPVQVSVTVGAMDTIFAQICTTNTLGTDSFFIINPTFPVTATVTAEAVSDTTITTAEFKLYFSADIIRRIALGGSPEVINTNGDRAKITAVATDSLGNRVRNARIAFNMIEGPGGGEYLDPPTAITRSDGTAETYLISGSIPSKFREVKVVAGDFGGLKSDTIYFTIAGPPNAITVRRDIGEISDGGDGTYSLNLSAIVTDVNGNPVADGTEVTFGLKTTGYIIYRLQPQWIYAPADLLGIDTVGILLPFEDLNDNFLTDPGEDNNGDGIANRGEDRNGNGIAEYGPGFEDINHNGRRDINPEPSHPTADSIYADYNGNDFKDFIEPLLNPRYQSAYYRRLNGVGTAADTLLMDSLDADYWSKRDAVKGGLGFDYDWNRNGKLDPRTTAMIPRTIQTAGGKAPNIMTYGQSDAWRIQIMVGAEANGITAAPLEFVLPLLKKDREYFGFFDD